MDIDLFIDFFEKRTPNKQNRCNCKTTNMASAFTFSECVREVETVLIGNKLPRLKDAIEKGDEKAIKETAKNLKQQLKKIFSSLSDGSKMMFKTLIEEGKTENIKSKSDVEEATNTQVKPEPGKSKHGNNYESSIDVPKPSSASPKQSKRNSDLPPSVKKAPTAKTDAKNLSKTIATTSVENKSQDPHQLHINMLEDKAEKNKKVITDLQNSLKEATEAKERCERKLKDTTDIINTLERNVNEHYGTNSKLKDENENLRNENTKLIGKVEENIEGQNEREKRLIELDKHLASIKQHRDELKVALEYEKKMAQEKSQEDKKKYEGIKKEHDDLKSRYSKIAATRLQDGNPNLTDLNDPSRPMKVSEKFSQIYDDSWTDVFQAQTSQLKRDPKDVIQHMLDVLEECYKFCERTAQQQMDGIRNLMLHPCQDPDQLVVANASAKGLNRPRIASQEQKELKSLLKKIGIQTTVDIRQKFVMYMQKKTTGDKSASAQMAESLTFYKESADICWLMVLNDPPVYMKMDAKPGDKIDQNLYTKYSPNGNEIDYLVWPPLGIKGGGFLSKGVVEPKQKK